MQAAIDTHQPSDNDDVLTFRIREEVEALIPDTGGFRPLDRQQTRTLRDRVLAQSQGIRDMDENCLLNGRQQDLVMAEAVFSLSDEYHAGTLDSRFRKEVEAMARQLGIRMEHLR